MQRIPNSQREILPSSMEPFTLESDYTVEGDPRMHRKMLQAVADLVENQRFTKLREVCLWHLAMASSQFRDWKFELDAEAVRRIRAKGVSLHYQGIDGGGMKYEEHNSLHPDLDGSLTEVETDPRPLEQRDVDVSKLIDIRHGWPDPLGPIMYDHVRRFTHPLA